MIESIFSVGTISTFTGKIDTSGEDDKNVYDLFEAINSYKDVHKMIHQKMKESKIG
jgi:hypothetical protein